MVVTPLKAASSKGSGAAPAGACASRVVLTFRRSRRAASSTVGYRGSISISVWAITAAAAMRANHLRSAGMTYQGAHSVLVWESISENARW